MEKNVIKRFWNCGDSQLVRLACERAGLTRKENEVLRLLLTECLTQEEAAEEMELSTRKVQELWSSASKKLNLIYWVKVVADATI